MSHSLKLHTFFSAVLALTLIMTGLPAVTPPAAVANGAATYWVDQATGNDTTGDGSEAAPFKTITKALDVAGNADTVVVGPGIYNDASGETFPLWFNGTSMQSVAGAAATILESNETSRVAQMQQNEPGDFISGFTFRDGAGGAGAGIACYLSWTTGVDSPRIEDNIFEDNDANDSSGGALYFYASSDETRSPLVQGNVFRDNHGGGGGAVAVDPHVSARIVDNEFRENTARTGAAIRIRTDGKSVEIADNVFGANEAVLDGGAIYVSDSNAPAEGPPNVNIVRNAFSSNIAQRNGGALYFGSSAAWLYANDGATSDADEGGFGYLADGSRVVTANNRIFGGSVDTSGAAWRVVDSALGQRHDTVAANSGASGLEASGASGVYVDNCIYWNDEYASPAGAAFIEIANANRIADSCVRDADVAAPSRGNLEVSAVISDDPLFVDMAGAEVRLGAGSPCIDTANPGKSLAEDYFGGIRPLDGDGSGTAEPDMGFHEFKPQAVLTFYAPSVSAYRSTKVYGWLKNAAGERLAGKPVEIWYYSGGWKKATTVITDANGKYVKTMAPRTMTSYRAFYAGDDTLAETTSVTRRVLPRARLTRTTSWRTLSRFSTYDARGFIEPRHYSTSTKVVVLVYKRGRDGRYRYYKSFTARYSYYSSTKTRYTARVRFVSRGAYKLVARRLGDSKNHTTYGKADNITVR